VENPVSGLKTKVKGVSFSETIDIRDPYTKQVVKKEIKPYMVDNLRQYLEKESIVFPGKDDEIFMQLISYVVVRTTQTGRPVFEAGGSAVDHAHDALILALLSITQNYSDLHKSRFATNTESFSNTFFMPKSSSGEEGEKEKGSGFVTGRAESVSENVFGFKKRTGRKPSSRIKRSTF
jgi:hypothetical protein